MLVHLPVELVQTIAERLEHESDINAFAQTATCIHKIVDPYLYRFNAQHEKGSALFWAAKWGQPASAQKSLEAGAQTQPKVLQAALLEAARNGHKAVVGLLLTAECIDPDLKNSERQTPLPKEAANGHVEVIEVLLATEGVDPDSQDNRGQTPLWWATQGSHEEATKMILIYNDCINPDTKNAWGETPLSWASRNGKTKVVG